MKVGSWARLILAAAPLLAGCGNFWQAPSTTTTTSFALTNSGNISVIPAAATGNTSTITVSPSNSFTGTVSLACTVSSPPSATSPTTCAVSPQSVSITSTAAVTATLTATTTATTTLGDYEITVTGTSGSTSETTIVCVAVSNSSGSCSSSSTSGNFYVLNQETNQVAALSILAGQLNTIDAKTLPAVEPLAIAVAPNGNFLYVSTVSGIFLYTIGSSGALTLGNGGHAITSDAAATMQVDATNSWLVEAVSGIAQLNAINVVPSGANAGTLANAAEKEQIVALPVGTVTQLAISPNDSSSCNDCYVFVGLGAGGTEIVNFNPGASNPFGGTGNFGVLHGGGDNAVAVDPSNRLLYVGEADALPSATQSGGLRVFTISSKGVTELTSAGSPYTSGGTGPSSILPSADGKYVYVANHSVSSSADGNITSYSVSTTSLTSIGTATAGPSGQIGLAEDSTGSFLLAVDAAGGPDLQAYSMTSGTLTTVLSVATGTDPVVAVAIAAAP